MKEEIEMLRGKTRLLGIIFLAAVIAAFFFLLSQRQTVRVFAASRYPKAGTYLTEEAIRERESHPS
ncbi:MAG: hypothetical protein ACP5NB_11255, partial [Chloroflexia bacterium]